MKNIHTIITACFTLSLLFVSCIEDEQLVQLGQGTLSLSGLELQAVATEQVATRALSEDFTVQVYKEGAITPDTTFTYQSTQQSGSKVTLNVGNYYLKAYNAAHADGDYTRAVYCYQSEVFTIKEDWITYVNAYVLMVNYAVRLALPATFDIFFTLDSFTITAGGGSVSLSRNGETAYFDIPTSTTAFSYTLTAINNDGERQTHTGTYGYRTNDVEASREIQPGTVYEVTYSYVTQQLEVNN